MACVSARTTAKVTKKPAEARKRRSRGVSGKCRWYIARSRPVLSAEGITQSRKAASARKIPVEMGCDCHIPFQHQDSNPVVGAGGRGPGASLSAGLAVFDPCPLVRGVSRHMPQ